ncbi:hypothetical protein O3M35_004679 [Rhynocoris fuscipes]|uniref:Epidermal cell surface receptor n=1 Tax=Rhynocoris fuscipes TaxID=488301 RepID=A0AAW1CHA4_9HEMI
MKSQKILWYLLNFSIIIHKTIGDNSTLISAKGRALRTDGNLTSAETALDDVSMEEDGDTACEDGKVIEKGCEEICTCHNGRLDCKPRCIGPLLRTTMSPPDPDCTYKSTEDKCCSLLVCSNSVNSGPMAGRSCVYNNVTYMNGEKFNEGCSNSCNCSDGEIVCGPRCPQTNMTANTDQCLSVADRKDPCCTILYCDVNASDDIADDRMEVKLLSAVPANSTSLTINLDGKDLLDELEFQISTNQIDWQKAKIKGETVSGLEPGGTYYFRVLINGTPSNIISGTLPKISDDPTICLFKGQKYKIGDEFHDECKAYCQCMTTGVECASIECPSDFGLDVLDPQCISWQAPPDFLPIPPRCCPESLICKSNGSCVYQGERFENWAEIPDKLSGCKEKCFCASGNVTCRARCSPVPPHPPMTLECLPNVAFLDHLPDDNCCLHWVCPPSNGTLTSHMPGFPKYPIPDNNKQNGITIQTLEAIDDRNVRIVFSVPSVLVGLHGRVELRYTSDNKNNDPSTWEQQVFAPPNDLIATRELEFELGNLKPATYYRIRVSVVMRDIDNSPASDILIVKTLPSVSTTSIPEMIPVDADLHAVNINSTWATVQWRKFTENEMQFIDGVQLRYKEINGKVYQATPLIHRAVTSYTIEDLKPKSQYEIGIFFIPFPGQTTELHSQATVNINTPEENDPFKFDLNLEVSDVKSTSVKTSWSGVPYPVDKYIHIIRIIYQDEGGRGDLSLFKVAKRDSPAQSIINGLKPDTRYRLWLEAYLTNGKIRKSNVRDFTTKLEEVSVGESMEQESQIKSSTDETADYYGQFVAVSVIAGLISLAAIGLIIALARNQSHHKAPISSQTPRHKTQSTAAYDNPSYKVEINQETVDL